MIELRTGTPGAGKTLSAIEELFKLQESWNAKPETGRPIFVHNVRDLAIPHSPVPTKTWHRGGGKADVEVPDWEAMPDGSYVLIDEAQGFFPPRSSASEAPPHVAWLNTHRHRGFDIQVITQHPRLIDVSLRALVGKHRHYRRLFGGNRSACYEWDACSDSLAGLANAVTSVFSFPKNAFKFYKSAEIHTRQKFALPAWLLLPFLAVAVGLFAVPRAYSALTGGISGKGLAASPSASAPVAAPHVAALAATGAPATAAQGSATVPPVPQVEPSAAELPVRVVAGCIRMGSRCMCVEKDGQLSAVPVDACVTASTELGGLVPYDTTPAPQARAAPITPAPSEAFALATIR